jgi:hypothetical protein
MADYPDNEVGMISEEILEITIPQATALSNNGWVNLMDFRGYTSKDIDNWMTSSSRIPLNRGGINFPTVRARRVKALAYWVNRRILRGVEVIPQDFDEEALISAQTDYPIADMELDATDDAQSPETFSYPKWIDWQDSVITFLKCKKNVSKTIPLYYVIRKEPNPIAAGDMTELDEIIYHTPHTGAAYIRDNKQVHTYLTELTNGTEADQWIKEYRRTHDGRAAWIALCNHYDGPAEGDKRVTVARSDITLVHYRNESSFSFEKYSTRLRKAFTTLRDYGQPKCEKEKVEILLDQITTNDQRLVSSIAICRDSHSDTFDNACTYLSSQITAIFPQHQPNAFGKKGRGGLKTRVRQISSIKKKNGKVYCNGIDLSDTTRYYTEQEFTKIGREGRAYLNKCPKRKAHKATLPPSKKKRDNNPNNDERQVAAIINGVIQASRTERDGLSTTGSIPNQVQMPQHGSHVRTPPRSVNGTTTAGASTGSQSSPVRYDHLGNIVVSKVKTGRRITNTSAVSYSEYNHTDNYDVLPLEIDNHADTHCFGCNFTPFMWTGLSCSVSPFLSEYDAMDDVKICSAATSYTASTGETIILIFGQGLWFGDRMKKSLINPNQCRAYNIQVCDDPTDPYRELGFTIDVENVIPLVMEGSTAMMYTRCPTREELDTCRKFYLSDPDIWDPMNVTFPQTVNVSSLRGEIVPRTN